MRGIRLPRRIPPLGSVPLMGAEFTYYVVLCRNYELQARLGTHLGICILPPDRGFTEHHSNPASSRAFDSWYSSFFDTCHDSGIRYSPFSQ